MSNHIEELISSYMDNELTETRRLQVEEHLNACPECSELLNEFMNIQSQVFSVFHSAQAPETLENKVMHAIHVSPAAAAAKRRNWIVVPLLGVLCLIAISLVLTGSFLFRLGSIMWKVTFNLLYALGSILGSDPYIIVGSVGFSLLLITASTVSLKHHLKTKAIQGDSL